jgi:hypothetical protein
MGIITAALRELLAAGITGEALIAAIGRIESENPPDKTAQNRREWDRKYRQRLRHIHLNPPDPPDRLSVKKERKEEGKQRSVRASCPPDFFPNETTIACARRYGFDDEGIKSQVTRFTDDAAAHGRTYIDWQAACRKWFSSPYQSKTNGAANGTYHAANPNGKNVCDVLTELVEETRRRESEDHARLLPEDRRQ